MSRFFKDVGVRVNVARTEDARVQCLPTIGVHLWSRTDMNVPIADEVHCQCGTQTYGDRSHRMIETFPLGGTNHYEG